jgi:hypothetical protein
MTLDELVTYARQQYTGVGDRNFNETEIWNHIWAAQMELARKTYCIRSVQTTTTVASQQEYVFPTSTIAIKEARYNGYRIEARSLEEVLDLTSGSAIVSGASHIYAIWNETLYLGPIPDGAYTLKIFSINEPQQITTSTATLEVPTRYQLGLSKYLLKQFCLKDTNYQGAQYYGAEWDAFVLEVKAEERKLLRGQKLSFVRDADGDLGSVEVVG